MITSSVVVFCLGVMREKEKVGIAVGIPVVESLAHLLAVAVCYFYVRVV